MANYIDISLALSPDLPCWPGSFPLLLKRHLDMTNGDPINESEMSCNIHTGTHVDAPLHFVPDGKNVSDLPLDILVGPAVVVHLPDVDVITVSDLSTMSIPPDTVRLLLRTRNSESWTMKNIAFNKDYVALTEDAAHWIVKRGIRLIVVDYLSVQRYHDGPGTHIALLKAEVIILEGLDLSQVAAGVYELICLPLKLAGAEGSPTRAVLKTI